MPHNHDERVFQEACRYGRLQRILTLWQASSGDDIERMIVADDYAAFRLAARGGHLLVLMLIGKRLPDLVPAMIRQCQYESFRAAVAGGYAAVIERLWRRVPDHILAMIQAQNYEALRIAAKTGQMRLLKSFWRQIQEHHFLYHPVVSCFSQVSFSTLLGAYGLIVVGMAIFLRLSSITHLVAVSLVGMVVVAVRERYIPAMRAQMMIFLYYHPFIVAAANGHVNMVRAILEAVPPDEIPHMLEQYDALGRFAAEMRGHFEVVRAIEEKSKADTVPLSTTQINRGLFRLQVLEQTIAVVLEAHSALRNIAGDPDSSLSHLSDAELLSLEALRARYPQPKKWSVNQRLKPIREWLKEAYAAHPATFTDDAQQKITLPLRHGAFKALQVERSFSLTEICSANHAYYQHTVHSAFRLLSKPNRWVDPTSIHLKKMRNGEHYAEFEEYADLIALLWQAASDHEAESTNDYTIETRQMFFIQSLAEIARAHNWVQTTDFSLEFDNLQADDPSCYSGMLRRLYNGLQGHPLFVGEMTYYCKIYLLEQVRTYITQQLDAYAPYQLADLYQQYLACVRGESNDFSSLDIPSEIQQQWCDVLKQQCSSAQESHSIIQRCVDQFFDSRLTGSHFLKFMLSARLNVMLEEKVQMLGATMQESFMLTELPFYGAPINTSFRSEERTSQEIRRVHQLSA